MSFAIVTSASNTVTKTLGAADNLVDGISLGTEMFKNAMEVAHREQLIESYVETNKLIEEAKGLTEAQVASLQLSM